MIRKNFNLLLYWSPVICGVNYMIFLQNHIFIFRAVAFMAAISFYLALCTVFVQNYQNLRKNFNNNFVVFYIIIVLGLLFSSFELDLDSIVTLFTHPYSFLAFFIAIIALNVDGYAIEKSQAAAKLLNSIFPLFIIIDLLFFKNLIISNEVCYLLILEFVVQKKSTRIRNLYLWSLIFAMIILSNAFDNRALSIRLAGFTLLCMLFYILKFLNNKTFKTLVFTISLSAIAFIVIFFEKIFIHLNDMSSKSVDTTDTRTFIFTEFFSKFSGWEWLNGRGYLGTYYSSYFFHNRGEGDHFIRFTAEVGFIDILLKGGLLLLIPSLLIIVMAIIKGFILGDPKSMGFKFALFLLVDLFLFSIENWSFFSLHFMMIWLGVGVIFNEQKIKLTITQIEVPNLAA